MASAEPITVEVAYATPEEQRIISLEVVPGTTLRQAIEQSGVLEHFSEIDLGKAKVGVFGKLKKLDETSIAVVEIRQDGWYVLDMIHGRWGIRETSIQIIRACQRYKPAFKQTNRF